MNTALSLLKTHWGFSEFWPQQSAIINAVLDGKDTLALLPTGGGKSLCYQIPGLALEGVCIVISPLIALIHDQVNSLKEKKIKAIALTSQLTTEDTIVAFDNLQFGAYKFLYLSPEKLQSPFVQEKIKQLNISVIAIDEAHCISEWGHDFRPAYLQLKILRELKPKATIIALTATATARVLKDIQLNLELENIQLFKQSFERPNLTYQVIKTEDIYGNLLRQIRKFDHSVIVYVSTRKQTKDVCNFLLKNIIKSSYYHGGLSLKEKNDSYNSWINNTTPVMVATNAFGMGIDKPDVQAVIHLGIPNSLENFIQEAGRAGRNGANSYSLVLINDGLIAETQTKFNTNLTTLKFVKIVYQHLNQYYKIAIGELPSQSFEFSLSKFSDLYELPLLKVYNAINALERENIIRLDENFKKNSRIKFLVDNQQIFNFIAAHPLKKELIQLILRSYGGVVEHLTVINEYVLSKKLKQPEVEVKRQLNELNRLGILTYQFRNTNSKLSFLVHREDQYIINSISKNISQQGHLKRDKLNASISYVRNTSSCRNKQLLAYFDEIVSETCGKCDVCISNLKKKVSVEEISNQIIKLLSIHSLSSQELVDESDYSTEEILFSLKILLDRNKIILTSRNKIKLNS